MNKLIKLEEIGISLDTKGKKFLSNLPKKILEIKEYRFIGLLEPWAGSLTKTVLECKIHGRGDEFENPWTPALSSAAQSGCPKCSGKYKYTEQETITIINETGYIFHSFLNDFSGVNSKVIVECPNHGLGSSFDSPWITTVNNLKIGRGCPKCSSVYQRSTTEWQEIISRQGYIFLGFSGSFKGKQTRVLLECPKHGPATEFSSPWIPRLEDIERGNGCPKCGGVYRFSKEEYIQKINETGYRFIEFIGEWKVIHTLVNVECKTHGEGKKFKTPWLPTINNLTRGGDCPKCMKRYVYSQDEIIEKIENETKYIFTSFAEEFNGVKGKLILSCPTHGRGDEMNPQWLPTADTIFRGSGCPICGEISAVIENKDPQTPCTLYYIQFNFEGRMFYKIGITTRSIEKRFIRIGSHGISIENSTTRTLPLLTAITIEQEILNEFHLYKTPMGKILKDVGGGSECFSIDVFEKYGLTLDDYIEKFDKYL
jgi:hypothetical protein